jgi:hypothetical protein
MKFIENGIPILQASKQASSLDDLIKEKKLVRELLAENNVVLLRGFPVHSVADFEQLILKCLDFNLYQPRRLWYKKLYLKVTGMYDSRSYSGTNAVSLGERVGDYVQGPHVEGGQNRVRAKYLTMYCEATSPNAAETGIYNLNEAYNLLNDKEKSKYITAMNQFVFFSTPVNWLDKLLFKLFFSRQFVISSLLKKNFSIAFKNTPLVCFHPEKKVLCLQPWPFFKNTANAVHNAARACFPDRKNIRQPDPLANASNGEWRLTTKLGQNIEWDEDEKTMFFKKIFSTMKALKWQQGDVFIIDNIYYGHGRLEDNGSCERKLHQLQLGSFDAGEFPATE